MRHVLIFGLGYTGGALAATLAARGIAVSGTYRRAPPEGLPAGVQRVAFADAAPLIARASHVVSTIPPQQGEDPVLAAFGAALAAGPARWLGYYSTTGVYGDRGGAWVDETSAPAPNSERARNRARAEQRWAEIAGSRALDIFRIAGIYGPGRSALDDVRAGQARIIDRPGHVFGRIHRDDIAGMTEAAMATAEGGIRILHLCDSEPAEPARVITYAAGLLGMPAPPPVPYETAQAGMSEMARSFWAESRRVSNARTLAALGYVLRYPTYREGLEGILAQQRQ